MLNMKISLYRTILFKHTYVFIIIQQHISIFLLIPTKIVCFISRILIFYYPSEYSSELFRPTLLPQKVKAISISEYSFLNYLLIPN